MRLKFVPVIAMAVAISGCMLRKSSGPVSVKGGAPEQSSKQPQSATDSGGNGSSYAANAAKITDTCTLMPADLVKEIVPNANAQIRDQILKRCPVINGRSPRAIQTGDPRTHRHRRLESVSDKRLRRDDYQTDCAQSANRRRHRLQLFPDQGRRRALFLRGGS